MDARRIDHLVLDWNGTLIDDVTLAVAAGNVVRRTHGLPPLDQAAYRDAFCFPIRDFYARTGFDFDSLSFEAVIRDYLALFNHQVRDCALHRGARELVRMARSAGMRVTILSASHLEVLEETLSHHGLLGEVDHVVGLRDENAAGKAGVAQALDREWRQPGERVLMVGDTHHDIEVASALGWQAAIVPNGHQSPSRFDGSPVPLFVDLEALTALWSGPVTTATQQNYEASSCCPIKPCSPQ
jgi:phosphoglycolate phosphatase